MTEKTLSIIARNYLDIACWIIAFGSLVGALFRRKG